MEKFDIEYQYQDFLKRMTLVENQMHPEQRKQLRETFYGATGQILLLLRDEVSSLTEEQALAVLNGMISQVLEFFTNILK